MRITTLAAAVAATLALGFASLPATAGKADDEKWINQCVKDNKNEGAKEDVVKKYCACMNDKMDENETMSITQWEKKNPNAMKACEKASGWK